MQRREFCSWLSMRALVSSLSVVIAACSESYSPQKSSIATKEKSSEPLYTIRPDGFIAVGTVAELKESEQILDLKNDLIVVQNSTNQQLTALTSKCTHQGCPVGWDKASQILICPCHGSRFNSQGEILQGPAATPLKLYQVKVENNLVWVKVA